LRSQTLFKVVILGIITNTVIIPVSRYYSLTDSNLLLYLPMDKGSGDYLIDQSGNNYHGIIQGAS
jgi:hypothetical protein